MHNRNILTALRQQRGGVRANGLQARGKFPAHLGKIVL